MKNDKQPDVKRKRSNSISRRDVLRIGGLGLLAAGTASPLFAQTTSPTPGGPSTVSTDLPVASPRNTGMTHVVITPDNLSLVRDRSRCTACGQCLTYCYRTGTVHGHRSSEGRQSCIHCGQCSIQCETRAITEKSQIAEFQAALDDPEKIVVVSTSPAVRVALGEMFRMPAGSYVEGKMVAALKNLGCDFVLDTTFGADLTVMEESSELLRRLEEKPDSKYPMFTSCCPAWVRFAELFYPQLLPHISTTKSPILMQGATIKTWFARKNGIDPKKVFNVALTPCTAKKSEIRRPDSNTLGDQPGFEGLAEMDLVITAREWGRMLYEKKVDFAGLPAGTFDSLMGRGSGGGVDFGRSGGVLASALRTAYFLKNKENAPQWKTVSRRGLDQTFSWTELFAFGRIPGVREGTFDFKGREIRVAAVETTGSLRALVDMIEHDGERFDFVEVMSCQGGCLGGGGQPYPPQLAAIPWLIDKRKAAIREGADASRIRLSHENKDVAQVYDEFFGKALSDQAEKLLHRKHGDF